MRRRLGVIISCVVLLLTLVMGATLWADFSVSMYGIDFHRVRADPGSFETNWSYDVRMYNDTDGLLSGGSVLVLDTGSQTCPSARWCVKEAPVGEMERVIGVATADSAVGTAVSVAVSGIFFVWTTGSVSAGDLLKVSSTTAGSAERAAAGEKGVFAIALQEGEGISALAAVFSKQELF